MFPVPDEKDVFIAIAVIAAIAAPVGWAVIEGIIWISKHLHWSVQ